MPPASIDIGFDAAQLARAKAALEPKQLARALFSAVDRTTKGAATDIKRIIREETNVQAKYLSRIITAAKPTGDPPVGVVKVSHKRIPLVGYGATGSKGGGVTALIGKNRAPLHLRHGFFTTVGIGGHRGVFTRSRHLPSKGPYASGLKPRGLGHKPRTLKIGPSGFADQFGIEERFGPAITDLLNVRTIAEDVFSGISDRLDKNLNSQIDRFTK